MDRCDWKTEDPIYIEYHDTQWGVPVHDDMELFEMLILEGAQAGLSWITILKRRDAFKSAYNGFDPVKMAQWDDSKIQQLLKDQGIIRNRLKIEAARANAQAYLRLVEEVGSFSSFLWSFVGGKPVINFWKSMDQVPVNTPESSKMSQELKKRGFKFAGPTICYAFMQSVGMVNDHLVYCFRHSQLT